jgi:hypothetical protein
MHHQPQSDQDDPGQQVYGSRARHHRGGSAAGSPDDWSVGPRLGLAYTFNVGSKPAVFRQLGPVLCPDPDHLHDRPSGAERRRSTSASSTSLPAAGWLPNLNPDSIRSLRARERSTAPDDPERNPRVMKYHGHLWAEPHPELHRDRDHHVRKSDYLARGQQHAVEP